MAKQTVQIQGLRELGLAIKELDSRLQKRIGRNAVAAAARVIQKEARQRAPVLKESVPHRKAGTVKKRITAKADKPVDGHFQARVWVKGIGAKAVTAFKKETGKQSRDNPDDPYYWYFLEFGTVHTPAQPFMRPAFEAKKGEAAEKMKDNITQRLAKEAADVGRTVGKVR